MDLDLAYDLDLERDLASRTAPPEDWWVGSQGWLGLYAPVDGDDAGSVPSTSTVLDRVEAWGPSVDTLMVLEGLDPQALSPFDQVTYLSLVDAHVGWLEGIKQRAVLAVAGIAPLDADDSGREEVALAIRLSPSTAQRRIDTARTLAWFAPTTRVALDGGQVSVLHAAAVAETITALLNAAGLDAFPKAGSVPDPAAVDLAGKLEAVVFPKATRQCLADLRRSLARAAARLQPVQHAVACERAARERKVARYDLPDGMIQLVADLPAADAMIVWAALDTAARADPRPAVGPCGVGVDAKRADALTAWARHVLADPNTPRRHGRVVSVGVTIDLPTLLGLQNNPGELVGYGPIPAPVARALAADATWHRLVTDPVTGHLLDYGRTTYTPPQPLRDYLIARDQHCVHHHCHRAAQFCQIDHIKPWNQGGTTAAHNNALPCTRHHHLKTRCGWTYVLNPDGTTTWTTPTGHTYTNDP